MLLDAIARRFRAVGKRARGNTFYVCHARHEHDRIYTENVCEYLAAAGVTCKVMEFEAPGNRPELRQCLDAGAMAVLGINAQLDHCWLERKNFLLAAARRRVPVIHWIDDHPSARWPEFTHATAGKSRFLLVSETCELYFRRYALADARTAFTAGVGPNRRSRVAALSRESFLARGIACLIALNLRRLGGTLEDARERQRALEPGVARAVAEAIERARLDLANPLEPHLADALARHGRQLAHREFHSCFQIVEETTQIWRRRRIFEIAAKFPVRIQTDFAPQPAAPGTRATFIDDAETNSMPATIERMKSCRSILNVGLTNDFLHDRIANGLNAGCAVIVERTPANERLFADGKNALLFRYDDDSLAECLDLVCNRPDRAFEIAQAGLALRDHPAVRFGGFDNILKLAQW